MFTGLVEMTGRVVALMPLTTGTDDAILRLIIDPGATRFKTHIGDSIAVNGCCLTVVKNDLGMLAFDVSKETMQKTCFSMTAENDLVNLERALAVGDRLGGHMVSGHIDGTGKIKNISKNASGWVVVIDISSALGRYVISKGSICIDGVSLTVNDLTDSKESTAVYLTLIPKTVEVTTFKGMGAGRVVNVEVDMIGKYLERLGLRGAAP